MKFHLVIYGLGPICYIEHDGHFMSLSLGDVKFFDSSTWTFESKCADFKFTSRIMDKTVFYTEDLQTFIDFVIPYEDEYHMVAHV